jgi:inner membrane protein
VHRSLTHSLCFALVVAPLIGWGLQRLHRNDEVGWRRWSLMAFLVLITHVIIDCYTTYGTQVFQPFSSLQVAFRAISIVDPLCTLPLLAMTLALPWFAPESPVRRRICAAGVALTGCYLLWCLGAKAHVNSTARAALAANDIAATRFMSKPTIFNTVLWRIVAEAEDGYYVAHYSLLDDDGDLRFVYTPANHDLATPFHGSDAWQALAWVTDGYVAYVRNGDTVVLRDMRYGRIADWHLTDPGGYVFAYALDNDDGTIVPRQLPRPDISKAQRQSFRRRIGGDR